MDDKESRRSFLYPSLECEGQHAGRGSGRGHADAANRKDKDGLDLDIDDLDNDDYVLGTCGLGAFNPMCLQRCKTIGCFTAVYGLASIMTSALFTYIASQITTLERHFNFNSSVSGVLLSCNDFGYFMAVLVLSHLTRRLHIPRSLALSTFLYGVSGVACTIPYFGTRSTLLSNQDAYTSVNNSMTSPSQMCERLGHVTYDYDADDNVTSCPDGDGVSSRGLKSGGIHGISDTWRTAAIVILGVCMTLQGVAKSPRQTFVGVYIDDNGPKTKTPLYLGVIAGLSIFGPASSFILGGVFSSFFITLTETQLTPRDPRWLGAWWMGFMLFGAVALVAGIPLLCFPGKLRVKPEVAKAERNKKLKRKGNNKVVSEIREFLKSVLKLLLNPVFVLVTLGNACNLIGISGFVSFSAKYLEVHFTKPAWTVNIVLGAMNIGGAAIGTVVGGVVTSRFKLSPYACLKLVISILCISCLFMVTGFAVKCEQPVIVGGALDSNHSSTTSACSRDCRCNQEAFFPVCGEDGANYFSPCHAGCTAIAPGGRVFTNCNCMSNSAHQSSPTPPSNSTPLSRSSPAHQQAIGGLCDSGCGQNFWIYVLIGFAFSTIGCFMIMPNFIITARSVPESMKPMAMGIAAFAYTLIGWFPGPIIFGAVIDTSCLISQRFPCQRSKTGACLLYDLDDLRKKYHGLLLGVRVISLVLVISAFIYAKMAPTSVFQDHKDEEEKTEVEMGRGDNKMADLSRGNRNKNENATDNYRC